MNISFSGQSAAWGSQANQPMDYMAVVEDLSMGLIENRRKNERFEGVRDVSTPANLCFSLHFPITSSRELLFLFFE